MKKIYTNMFGILGGLIFGMNSAIAAPTLYINNQVGFSNPIVYGWGTAADGTSVSTNMPGESEGQVTKDDFTFDKYTLPAEAAGVKLTLMYTNDWRESTTQEITFEDQDYYLVATASGLVPYVEGGNNTYYMLYVNPDELPFKMNTGYHINLYAVSEEGTEPYGPYPGKDYAGLTDIIDDLGYYIYSIPASSEAFKLTFSRESENYKATSDFSIVPDKNYFIRLVGADTVELMNSGDEPATAPVLYINNQVGFSNPIVYGWGTAADGTSVSTNMPGESEGQVTKDGLTFDKYTLPVEAAGVKLTLMYTNDWRESTTQEITFEGQDYYLIATASGLVPYVEGGNNTYYMLYVNPDQLPFKMNTGYHINLYAVSEEGTEPYGPYPGKDYAGLTDIIDDLGYYIYSIPASSEAFKLTFSRESENYKATSDFSIVPDKNYFIRLVGADTVELMGNPETPDTDGIISYEVNDELKTAAVAGLKDPENGAQDLVIPATVTIGGVEYTVTSIKPNAFAGNQNITGTLTLGENLVTIGAKAFSSCQQITGSLTFGDNVTTIGDQAFSGCLGLDGTLTFGNSLKTIGESAFLFCHSLTGGLTFSDALETIGEAAFYGCSKLDGGLHLGNSVKSIGRQAFCSNSAMTGDLVLPNSLTDLGYSAFMSCGFDGTLTLPETMTVIPESTFFGCNKLTGSINIPGSVTTIGSQAFYGCESFTGTLTIPDGVKTIGASAFNQCKGLNGGLELGSGLETIEESAFMFCENLMGWLSLPESLKTIGDNAFAMDAKFTGPISIPENVTYIGAMAFGMCEGFNGKITIGKNVKTIGDQAFVSCCNLKGTLSIPEGVENIGYRTFAWCWTLTGLELPSTLKSIGNLAFYSCWNLESIKCAATVPPTITEGNEAFSDDNYTDATLFVPSEGYNAYKEAYEWKEFQNIEWTGTTPPDSGIGSINSDIPGEDAIIFNLQGQRITNPSEGEIVIVKTPAGSRKMIFSRD